MAYDDIIKAISSGFQQFSMLDLLDILIIAVLLYQLISWTKETRAFEVLKGIAVLFLCSVVSTILSLHTLSWLLDSILTSGSIIIVLFILFQPEIRRVLEKLGRSGKRLWKGWLDVSEVAGAETVRDLYDTIRHLSKKRIGALIVFEQKTGLGDIIRTGTRIDGSLSGALLANIFEPNTPLHDGAVIVRGNSVVAAGCILPLAPDERSISRELGTRHRAAIGVSSVSDSVTIVVSEETGTISMARDGNLIRPLDDQALQVALEGLFLTTPEIPFHKKDEAGRKSAFIGGIKHFFTRNVAVKVIALLFAMMLWGYVLADQRPSRIKTVTDVRTSFDGEAELLAQGLCVRGDRKAVLEAVSVAVRAQITNYSDVTNKTVNATINLKNISEAREYELPINASVSSALGTVQSVTPSTVKVEIDSLVSRTIPVTTSFTGETPEGYWADMEALSATTRLDISGAKTDLSTVTRAECIVDMTGRKTTVNDTFEVILYDSDGNVVDNGIVVGAVPSATVRLPIMPVRNVSIDVMGALQGTDDLAANHELVSAVATPATVRIVGDQEKIDRVESIALEPIAVNGMNAATTVETEIVVPEDVRVIDTDPISVLIDIRETVIEQSFEQLAINVTGLKTQDTATLDAEWVDLNIEGRISIVSLIKRGDIDVNVDVTGLEPGTYELQLFPFVRDEKTTVELNMTLSRTTVKVTITGP